MFVSGPNFLASLGTTAPKPPYHQNTIPLRERTFGVFTQGRSWADTEEAPAVTADLFQGVKAA